MEFNAIHQFRQKSNRSFTISPNPNRHAAQIMYPYGSIPLQPSQTQALQHSRPPQPFTTWSAGQNTSAYLPSLKSSNISLPEDGSPQIQTVDSTELGMVNQSAMAAQAFHQVNTQEAGMQADFIQSAAIDSSSWSRKTYDNLEFPNLDPDMPEFDRDFVAHDEDTPIIYLGQYSGLQGDVDIPSSYHLGISRRMSESSFSMSSTVGGGVAEIPSYEDLSSSDVISHTSDCEGWNSLEPAPNLLSPLASPRRPHHELHRSGSRSRASPAPHTSMRSSPYSLDSGRFKRWSTGTYAPTSTPSGSRTITQVQDRFATYGKRLNPHHSMPVYPPSSLGNFPLQTQNVLYSQPHPLQSSNPCIFASQDQPFHLEVPRPLPSQGLFRLLQSNADRHTGCSSHFADLSDPPDLYASLHDEPSNPPESDMNPSDPDLIPHEQDLRFVDDLYTPRWVRGHGNKREGWCGLCKPGRWLVLKNSAFWYDKSFTHGVSAATGAAFHGPQETRRTEGNLDVWEGLCGSCGEWIALVSSKKKGTTWFRHAYKCHTHQKVKDGPKRRRETSYQIRARAVSSASAASSTCPVTNEPTRDVPNSSASSNPDVTQELKPDPRALFNTAGQRQSCPQLSTLVSENSIVGLPTMKTMNPLNSFASMI